MALDPTFIEEARTASEKGDAAKLILMGLEAAGAPWEDEARPMLAQVPQRERTWDLVLLFTGHRVDSGTRKTPRFPPAKEPVARDAIKCALEAEWQSRSPKNVLGVAGGANGGDILFHEVCEELGIATEMPLALPPDQFAKASVAATDDPSWMQRFSAQLEKHPQYPVLAQSPELPAWLTFKPNYDIWQRNNLWLLSEALSHNAHDRTLIALWDGEPGDGPGGTEHMVRLAQEHEARVVLLNTKQLFGLL